MENKSKKSHDWKFIVGMSLMVLGYLTFNVFIWLGFFGLPFFLIGIILVA